MTPNPLPEFPQLSPSSSCCSPSSNAAVVIVDTSFCPPGLIRIKRQNRIYKGLFEQVNLRFPEMDQLGTFKIPIKRTTSPNHVQNGFRGPSKLDNHRSISARSSTGSRKNSNDFSGRSLLMPHKLKIENESSNSLYSSYDSISWNYEGYFSGKGKMRRKGFKSPAISTSSRSPDTSQNQEDSRSSFRNQSMKSPSDNSSPKNHRPRYKFCSEKNDEVFFSDDDDDDETEISKGGQEYCDGGEKSSKEQKCNDKKRSERRLGLVNGHVDELVATTVASEWSSSSCNSDQSAIMTTEVDMSVEDGEEQESVSFSPPSVVSSLGRTSCSNGNSKSQAALVDNHGLSIDQAVGERHEKMSVDKEDDDFVLTLGLSDSEQDEFLFD